MDAPLGSVLSTRAVSIRVRVSPARIVYAAAGVYATVFVGATVAKQLEYGTTRLDLGNMTQAVWNTAHGRFLEYTSQDGRQMTRLGVHSDPFLALLAPFSWLGSTPLALLIFQALAVTAGVLPVYWLGRKHLQTERSAAMLALVYLLYPATQFNALPPEGFHSSSVGIPLILFAIWFLDEDRLIPFGVFALLAASTKEEMPLVVGCLGIWYAFAHKRPRVGIPIFLAGSLAAAVNFLVVIPHFAPPGVHPFRERYAAVGGTPTGIVRKLFADPSAAASTILTTHHLLYVVLLFVPLLGLWFRQPLLAACAIPELAINLLTSKPSQTTIFFHYTAGIVPFAIAATILGTARVGRRRQADVSTWIFGAVVATAALSPLWGLRNLDHLSASNPAHAAKKGALALIPADAVVSSTNYLGPQLAERRRLLNFPETAGADWVIADLDDPTSAPGKIKANVVRLTATGRWRIVYNVATVRVLRRIR
jgi:uncharacterized membrane protein